MPSAARLAVGNVQAEVETAPITWALLEALRRSGLHVQHYHSRAFFVPHNGAAVVTGLESRHLDTWLMSRELCQEVFSRGAAAADLSVVEGQFADAQDQAEAAGGNLDLLCRWLDTPRLAVIDVARLDPCRLPYVPPGTSGLLFDRVADRRAVCRWQTVLEGLWQIPVLGALDELPSVRASIAALPRGSQPCQATCRELGDSFVKHSDLSRLRKLAGERSLPDFPCEVFRQQVSGLPIRVAVAHDAAFNCYFPDALDLLELRGATVIDFSPLRDDKLPPDTDIVYLGCGHPERHATELAENHCMRMGIREHVHGGGRVYAEGGGLAYLSRQIALPDGARYPMAGVLPSVAHVETNPHPPEPIEVTLTADSWLGEQGGRLRGYRGSNWRIEPVGELSELAAGTGDDHDLVASQGAIGSRIHFNFAAQPAVLGRFLRPAASLSRAGARRGTR